MTINKTGTLSSVIIWSVISAAFIGPGTVTTAATAGSAYQLDLLWAVVFAVVACILLQEVSARLVIESGRTMGEALIVCYGENRARWLQWMLAGPVLFGCAAYEAGNILGAVSGLQLITGGSTALLTILISLSSFLILWSDRRNLIGWLMTALVGMMGIAFIVLALRQHFPTATYLKASFVPSIPEGSELIVLALVGTTIVPYNLFLGSGISKGQTVPLMRVGLTISVLIGGLITAAILIAGTPVGKFSSFSELAQALETELGTAGPLMLGIGLFAAGFSSAITSPYASSVIVSTVFQGTQRQQRFTWILVLLTGFAFGISGVKPIPVILTVQALNGFVLPLLTAFLILLINHPALRIRQQPVGYQIILLGIFASVLMMGLNNVDRSLSGTFGLTGNHWMAMIALTVVFTAILSVILFRQRSRS